jgi:hypothetical protein
MPPRRLAAFAGASIGLIVSAAQLIVSVNGVLDKYRSVTLVVCGVTASKAVITIVSVGVCVTALSAMVSFGLRRYSLVFAWLGAEAALLVTWIVLGGTKVATCVL